MISPDLDPRSTRAVRAIDVAKASPLHFQYEAPRLVSPRAPSAAARWLRVLLKTFWLLLGISVLVAAVSAVRGIMATGDWMYSDGVQVAHVLRVRDGLGIYADISEPPFVALLYWPLHFLVAGLLARAASLDVASTMYLTRAITLLGTLLVAGSIAGLAALCGARWRGTIAAAGLFLTAFVVHPWAYAARPDLPALGLVLLGVLVLLRTRGPRGALAAGLLMGAGFGFKQSFVVGVTAACLMLLWQRQLVRLLGVCAGWGLVVGGTALVMNGLTDGRFLAQTIASNVMPWRPEMVLDQLRMYVPLSLPVLALAVLGWRREPGTEPAVWTLRLYGLLALVTTLVALARVGAYYNYLIEMTAILAVFAGLGVERCVATLDGITTDPDGPARRALGPLLALAIAVAGFGLPLLALANKAVDPPDRALLIEALREAPGPVLTEKDVLAVLLAGKEPIGGDPFGDAFFAAAGRWDPAPLNAMVRSGSFALIALNHPVEEVATYDAHQWWPPGTRELIQERYQFDRILGGFYLYRPGPERVSAESDSQS